MILNEKIAVITGGASGIGLEIMHRFAGEGAKVINADINIKQAERVCARLRSLGFFAEAIETDISNNVQVERMVKKTLKQFGHIDILVNNAGISGEVPFLKMTLAEWKRVLNVNLNGQFFTSRAVARVMADKGSGGKIVNVTSVNAKVAGAGLSHYCASKGGLQMLTKVMALELAPYRINVNAVAPGIIDTKLTASALADQEKKNKLLANVPLNRIGQPLDVAAAALFLVSDGADYITGATLLVDGGWLV